MVRIETALRRVLFISVAAALLTFRLKTTYWMSQISKMAPPDFLCCVADDHSTLVLRTSEPVEPIALVVLYNRESEFSAAGTAMSHWDERASDGATLACGTSREFNRGGGGHPMAMRYKQHHNYQCAGHSAALIALRAGAVAAPGNTTESFAVLWFRSGKYFASQTRRRQRAVQNSPQRR
jgi:hypothetical protein